MKHKIRERVALLRTFMQEKEIRAFIVPSTDPHSGEYVPEFWESRKWISGFTGSAAVSYTHLRAHETRSLISYAVFCL